MQPGDSGSRSRVVCLAWARRREAVGSRRCLAEALIQLRFSHGIRWWVRQFMAYVVEHTMLRSVDCGMVWVAWRMAASSLAAWQWRLVGSRKRVLWWSSSDIQRHPLAVASLVCWPVEYLATWTVRAAGLGDGWGVRAAGRLD